MELGVTNCLLGFRNSILLPFRGAEHASYALLLLVNHQILHSPALFFVPIAGELSLTQVSPGNFECLHNLRLDQDCPRVKLFWLQILLVEEQELMRWEQPEWVLMQYILENL